GGCGPLGVPGGPTGWKPIMKLHGLLVVAAGLLAAADVPKGSAGTDDLKRLQGTWSTVSVERGGVAVPEEEAGKIKLTVRGNRYTYPFQCAISQYGTMSYVGTFSPTSPLVSH